MDDLISRANALNIVKDVCEAILSGCGSHYDGEDEVYDDLREVDAVLKCNKEIRTALKHLPSAQQWIPCKERLPKKSGEYIVSGKWASGKVAVGSCEYSKTDGYFQVAWTFDVLAWAPLPTPYRPEGEEHERID